MSISSQSAIGCYGEYDKLVFGPLVDFLFLTRSLVFYFIFRIVFFFYWAVSKDFFFLWALLTAVLLKCCYYARKQCMSLHSASDHHMLLISIRGLDEVRLSRGVQVLKIIDCCFCGYVLFLN